jgi:hypothetical protein
MTYPKLDRAVQARLLALPMPVDVGLTRTLALVLYIAGSRECGVMWVGCECTCTVSVSGCSDAWCGAGIAIERKAFTRANNTPVRLVQDVDPELVQMIADHIERHGAAPFPYKTKAPKPRHRAGTKATRRRASGGNAALAAEMRRDCRDTRNTRADAGSDDECSDSSDDGGESVSSDDADDADGRWVMPGPVRHASVDGSQHDEEETVMAVASTGRLNVRVRMESRWQSDSDSATTLDAARDRVGEPLMLRLGRVPTVSAVQDCDGDTGGVPRSISAQASAPAHVGVPPTSRSLSPVARPTPSPLHVLASAAVQSACGQLPELLDAPAGLTDAVRAFNAALRACPDAANSTCEAVHAAALAALRAIADIECADSPLTPRLHGTAVRATVDCADASAAAPGGRRALKRARAIEMISGQEDAMGINTAASSSPQGAPAVAWDCLTADVRAAVLALQSAAAHGIEITGAIRAAQDCMALLLAVSTTAVQTCEQQAALCAAEQCRTDGAWLQAQAAVTARATQLGLLPLALGLRDRDVSAPLITDAEAAFRAHQASIAAVAVWAAAAKVVACASVLHSAFHGHLRAVTARQLIKLATMRADAGAQLHAAQTAMDSAAVAVRPWKRAMGNADVHV